MSSPRAGLPEVERTRAPGRGAWGLAATVYVLYAAAVLAPIWSAKVSPIWDGVDFNYPAFAYAARALRAGRLPLWDPYTNCGMPFHADPHYLWYQPAAALVALARASAYDGYMLFWALTWVWSGLGAMLLASSLGIGPLGGLVAALSFSMSGFFVGHGEHLPYVLTAAWSPWVLAFARRAMERRAWSDALFTGATLGLSALGGYGGLVVFEVLALATWIAAVAATPQAGSAPGVTRPALARRLGWGAVVLGLAVVLLALVWSPAVYSLLGAARGYTERTTGIDVRAALYGNPFSLRAAITLLFPRLATGQPAWFPADISMNDAYLGAVALPLAALWIARRRHRAWPFVLFVAFWFVASLGGAGGLRVVLHHLFPPTDYMRHNAMLRVFFLAPLAVAAGGGAEAILGDRRARATSYALAAWLAVVVVAGALLSRSLVPSPQRLATMLPPIVAIGAALAVVLGYAFGAPRRWAAALLVAVIAADLAWHLRVSDTGTIWAENTDARRFESAAGGAADGPRSNDPAMRWSNLHQVARQPVVEGFVALSSAFNEALVRSRYESVLRTHRFWLTPSAALAPARSEGLALLATHGVPGAVPVFVDRSDDVLAGSPVEPGTFGAVRVVEYAPERVVLEAEAPGRDAILASTERQASSWTVQVDGAVRPVTVVNYFFRGVRVPAGRHRIVFEYRPRGFVPLLATSYATLAISLASGVLLARRARRRAAARGRARDEERGEPADAAPRDEVGKLQASARSAAPARVALALLGAVWIIDVYRAATQSIVHDEAFAYYCFVSRSWRTLFTTYNAGHHVLQSILAKLAVDALGPSELALRLPSLAGALLYLAATFLLMRVVWRSRWGMVLGAAALSLDPNIMDFMSAARGYGLGLALFAWSTLQVVLVACDERTQYPRHRLVQAGAALGLAIAANLTYALPGAALAAVTAINLLRRARGTRDASRDWLLLFALPGLACFAAVAVPPLRALHPGEFYVGAADLRRSAADLAAASFSRGGGLTGGLLAATARERIATAAAGFLALAVVVGAAVALARRRAGRPVTGPAEEALGVVGGCLLVTIALVIGAHAVAGTPYPEARMGLYWPFLVYACASCLGGVMLAGAGSVRAIAAVFLVPLAIVASQSIVDLDPSSYYTWTYDRSTRRYVDLIVERHARTPDRRVSVGLTWLSEPAVNFYQATLDLRWMDRPDRSGPLGCFDYYILIGGDRDLARRSGMTVLARDDAAQTLLAERGAAACPAAPPPAVVGPPAAPR